MKRGGKESVKAKSIIKNTPTILPDGMGIGISDSGLVILSFLQEVDETKNIEIGSFALSKKAANDLYSSLKTFIESENANS